MAVNFTDDKPVQITRKNFALQIQEVDPADFTGEAFSVNLGSVEEAMNSSNSIDPGALLTLAMADPNATASLSVSERVLVTDKTKANPNSSSDAPGVRLGYSVFVSTSLFPTHSANTTVASIILNVILSGFNKSTAAEDVDLFNVTFTTSDVPVR